MKHTIHLMQFSLVISHCNITLSLFRLSRGNVATLTRWDGWSSYRHVYRSSLNLTVKTALKSADFSRSSTKISWLLLWLTVYKSSAVAEIGDRFDTIEKKRGGQVSNFFTDRFTSKYATKSSLTIPPHLKGVAELPCETSVSENSENLMHASLSTTNHKVV